MLTRKGLVILASVLAIVASVAIPVVAQAETDAKAVQQGKAILHRAIQNLRVADRAIEWAVKGLNGVDRLAGAANKRLERLDKVLDAAGVGDSRLGAARAKLDAAEEAVDRARTLLKEAEAEVDVVLKQAQSQAGSSQTPTEVPGPTQQP